MRSLFLSLCLALSGFMYAQQDTFNFVVSYRVNFEEDPVREDILQLYKDFLNNRSNTTCDNPYWNKKEKSKYICGYNLSSGGLFNGYTADELKRTFDFYVLSIEKINRDAYSIRAMMLTKGGLKYGGSSVWCIHRVTAIKEDNEWRLQNNLVQETAKWGSYYSNKINYHFKDTLDYALASEAGHFVDSLRNIFNIHNTDTLDYYVAKDVDELGRLLGFDYFYSAYTTGVAGFSFIMSTKGAFYAHELVHFALRIPKVKSNYMVTEGIAEFYGTKRQNKARYYGDFTKLIKDILSKNYSVADLLAQNIESNEYNYKYPFGALLCELAYEKKGLEGLTKLLFSNTRKEEDLRKVLSDILSVKPNQLEKSIFDFAKSKEQLYKSLWEKFSIK